MRTATKHLKEDEPTVRQSVSFPRSQHEALSELAAHNNVSVGYVVRKACEMLVESCDGKVNELSGLDGAGNAV